VASREPDSGLRLTPAFVLLWDAAWTGPDGEPVFSNTGIASNRSTEPDPVRPEEVLEIHAINAQRCSEDRRNYGALVTLIKKLRER